jgi:hypothetical protein
MKNQTAKEIKAKSTYELEERLDALCSIMAKLTQYGHVFEPEERLWSMVQDEINDIVDELEAREIEELTQ